MRIMARAGAWLPVVGVARRELRRQRTARRNPFLRQPVSDGHISLTYRRVPVIARLDGGLRLDEHRRAFAQRIGRGLRAGGVSHWWLPAGSDERRTLCVLDEHRPALVQVIAELAEPGWYVDSVSSEGVRAGMLRSAADLSARNTKGWAGLVVWEFVASSSSSTFSATDRQGLRVHFWAPAAPDKARSLVRNTVVMELATRADGTVQVPTALRRPLISEVRFPIDAVYTWVDTEDEQWQKSKIDASGRADPTTLTERARDAVRFDDHGELRFSLRALEQFAPWINHVWIVTAGQHPRWLARSHPRVTVVSHLDIFPDPSALPTFNSHAIESCLHRIPGLAEHFLYLNDDMFFGRPLTADRFFHPSGLGKFFHSRALVDFAPVEAEEVASSTAAKNARLLLCDRFGVTLTRKFFHTAAALTRSGMTGLEREFPEAFAATREAKFRSVHDIAAAGSLYLNYGYVSGLMVPGRLHYTYIDPALNDAEPRLDRLSRRRDFDAFCLNDGATLESADSRRRTDQLIRRFLARYLPVPGSWETDENHSN